MKPNFAETLSLYAPSGTRKYLNAFERQRALAAMTSLTPDQSLFALTLAWTGARVSEVLALTPTCFQLDCGAASIRTLKRRRLSVREVPLPPDLITALDRHFDLSNKQRDEEAANLRLWPWHRVTAWRLIKRVLAACAIVGRHACPRGLRHSFGVTTLQAGVPLNLTQRWMGHARLSSTAVYANALGPEELAFAARFWRAT